MYILEDKLFCSVFDKKNKVDMAYLRTQVGKSEDGFATFAIELKNGTVVVARVKDILIQLRRAGVKC